MNGKKTNTTWESEKYTAMEGLLIGLYLFFAVAAVVTVVLNGVGNLVVTNSHTLSLWMFGFEVFSLASICLLHIGEYLFFGNTMMDPISFGFRNFWSYIIAGLLLALIGLFDLPYIWFNIPMQLQIAQQIGETTYKIIEVHALISIFITLLQGLLAVKLWLVQFPKENRFVLDRYY